MDWHLKDHSETKQAYHLSEDFLTKATTFHQACTNGKTKQLLQQLLKNDWMIKNVHFIQAQAGLGKTLWLSVSFTNRSANISVTVPTKPPQIIENEGCKMKKYFTFQTVLHKILKTFTDLRQRCGNLLQKKESNRLVNLFKMQVLVSRLKLISVTR